jgi:voltage-gated potassium channel
MKKPTLFYEIFLILLAITSVGILIFEITHELAPQQTTLLSRIDLGIAILFLADFIIGLIRAKDRWQFFNERWYELLASIPLTDATIRALRSFRILRILRIIRIIRVLRITARLKRLGDFVFDGPSFQLFSIGLIVTTLVFAGAVAFHSFENGLNPNVHSLFDSFWWAMVTVTTIGYGDIYPVTTEGRIIAMALMLIGIGTLGTATATIASNLLTTKEQILRHKTDNE